MRSPAMPKNGEINVPRNCSEPNTASANTEPVETSTNQPRITPSISKAHEARRSAGHWKRKLRTPNGASAGTRAMTLTSCSFPSLAPCWRFFGMRTVAAQFQSRNELFVISRLNQSY